MSGKPMANASEPPHSGFFQVFQLKTVFCTLVTSSDLFLHGLLGLVLILSELGTLGVFFVCGINFVLETFFFKQSVSFLLFHFFFSHLLASLFDVFGAVKEGADDPSLRAGSFLETFITLTEKDPSMTAERLNALKEQLPKGEGDEGKDDDVEITFADVMKTEAFQAILEASE